MQPVSSSITFDYIPPRDNVVLREVSRGYHISVRGLYTEPNADSGPRFDDTRLNSTLISGWERGEAPTAETIRQGTVRMEEHPDYDAAIQKVKNAGFEIKYSGEASVEWIEIHDKNQKFVRIEKNLHVAAGMRYIDLEHELGHIDQLTTRFGEKVPPTQKVVELPNGRRRKTKVLAGILTEKKKAILEYHNRLVEFMRLYQRGVDLRLLKEHAYGPKFDKQDGVEHWHKQYLWATNKEMSQSRLAWIEKYLPDLAELKTQYKNAIQTIEAGEYMVQ